jgi:carbonic anhydrase
MQTNFKFKGVHACEAVVLSCIDFRFWKDIARFVEEELGIQSYDFPSLPGAAKAINECVGENDLAMRCIGIPCDLHHVQKAVIVNHWDCGAYGGSKSFGSRVEELEFHKSELAKAKERLKKQYPNLEVITVLAQITEDDKNIEFLTFA